MLQLVDYEAKFAQLVDSWLDEEAIAMAGIDQGWDRYWEDVKEDAVNFPGCQDFCKVILNDGSPCAAVCYGIFQKTMTISEILVAPEVRGKGIGTKLLSQLIEIARKMGLDCVNCVTAVVYPQNAASRKSFQNAGFQIEGKTEDGVDLIFSYRF